MGMKNHEMVPLPLISSIAGIHRGATARALSDLAKQRLTSYERGKRYDGFRLTNLGYDFLALRALCSRGVVGAVGNQIGVGKESDVYVGGDPELNDLVLKFHRLGRTSFRKLKEKRDYHKRRHFCSWLYLSRIAALKEFSFLKSLYARNFPVPKPLDVCRHTVVMGLVDGTTLSHVDSVDSPSDLYDECMSLIVRLGKYGLIHGDFNEFNLMLTQDGKLVMIDFPQMISIDHENAEYYFNRDVECIREFFRRKFHYESEAFPKISDVERKHNLDVELAASGFTKEMAKDLNKAYDEGNFDVHLDEEEEHISEDDEDEEDDLDKQELEEEERESHQQREHLRQAERFTSWIQDAQLQLSEMKETEAVPELTEMDAERMKKYEKAIEETRRKIVEEGSSDSDSADGEDAEDENRAEAEPASTQRRGKVTAPRSVYSTGSTIAPAEIKKRLIMERNKAKKDKLRVKGKQDAVQRSRKQNKDLIKEYDGWGLF
ncbi:RIO-2 kinase [Aphelenchoides avenae]|nr:RIO-2 kinase [Aphelenchus avenae]